MTLILQLGYYLKEYIKTRELYDPMDPRIVYCHRDPLADAFGVNTFTLADAP